MPSNPRLTKEAHAFAIKLGDLLNHTVTNGPRLNVVLDSDDGAVIGYQVSPGDHRGNPIPLTVSKKKASLYLYVSHTLVFDAEQVYLTNTRSNYSLQVGDGSDAKELIAIDYTRDPKNKYPAAHIHIGCDSQGFSGLFKKRGLPKRKIRDLHIPVGGRRYRPCLEDLIEFCVLEELVDSRDEWEEYINHSREAYYQMQAAAVIRQSPEIVARILRDTD